MEYFDLTRVLLAFLTGYFLSICGSFSQVSLKNNLASPSTLGMDGLGVLLVIICSLFFDSFFHKIIVIFLLLIVLLPFVFSPKRSRQIHQKLSTGKLILLGLSFNLLIGAIFSLIQFLMISMNIEFPSSIWFGNFKSIAPNSILIFLFFFILSMIYINIRRNHFLILAFSDSIGKNLGLENERIKKELLSICLLLNTIIILFCGVFSFLALLFPHLLRSLAFFNHSLKNEILYGPFLCGLILMVIDQVCYTFTIYGAELPAGMIFSIIGALSLILILNKSKINFNA